MPMRMSFGQIHNVICNMHVGKFAWTCMCFGRSNQHVRRMICMRMRSCPIELSDRAAGSHE